MGTDENLLQQILAVLKDISEKLDKQGHKLHLQLNEIHKKMGKGLLKA